MTAPAEAPTRPGRTRLLRTRRRRLLRRAVGTAVVALLIVAGWTLQGWWSSPTAARDAGSLAVPSTAPPSPAAAPNAPGLSRPATLGDLDGVLGRAPANVGIPAIGVSSAVVGAGTDAHTGELEVPGNAHTTVWWADGSRPGDATGTTVLAAHVDWNGVEGVFFRLASLPVGATVTVHGQSGGTYRYRVTARRHVAKPALAGQDIFRTDGPPRLVLVTCGGAFDSSTRSYEDNVVVEAVPIV